jgi:hypothetical protein
MTLETDLREHLRLGSRALWHGARRRLVPCVLGSLTILTLLCLAGLWLPGRAGVAPRRLDAAARLAWIVVPAIGVCAGFAGAVLESLGALVVSGPVLRSLGDLVLHARLRPGAPDLAGQLGEWTSSAELTRLVRIRELPLLMFLTRVVLGVDVKPLLEAARTRVDAEALVRSLEDHARRRAAAMLRRARLALALLIGATILSPILLGLLFA